MYLCLKAAEGRPNIQLKDLSANVVHQLEDMLSAGSNTSVQTLFAKELAGLILSVATDNWEEARSGVFEMILGVMTKDAGAASSGGMKALAGRTTAVLKEIQKARAKKRLQAMMKFDYILAAAAREQASTPPLPPPEDPTSGVEDPGVEDLQETNSGDRTKELKTLNAWFAHLCHISKEHYHDLQKDWTFGTMWVFCVQRFLARCILFCKGVNPLAGGVGEGDLSARVERRLKRRVDARRAHARGLLGSTHANTTSTMPEGVGNVRQVEGDPFPLPLPVTRYPSITTSGGIDVSGAVSFGGAVTAVGLTSTSSITASSQFLTISTVSASGQVSVTDTTAFTSSSTESITTSGGIGMSGADFFGGAVTAVELTSTGSITATSQSLTIGTVSASGQVSVIDMTASTSTSTGSITTLDGIGVSDAGVFGGAVTAVGLTSTSSITATSQSLTIGTVSASGQVSVTDTTASTLSSTGSITTSGGIGVNGAYPLPLPFIFT